MKFCINQIVEVIDGIPNYIPHRGSGRKGTE